MPLTGAVRERYDDTVRRCEARIDAAEARAAELEEEFGSVGAVLVEWVERLGVRWEELEEEARLAEGGEGGEGVG